MAAKTLLRGYACPQRHFYEGMPARKDTFTRVCLPAKTLLRGYGPVR